MHLLLVWNVRIESIWTHSAPPPLLATALFWSTQVHSHNGKRYYPLTNPFLNQIVRIWCVQNCVRLILLDLNQNIIMFCFFLHLLNNFVKIAVSKLVLFDRLYSCDHLCIYNKYHATWSKYVDERYNKDFHINIHFSVTCLF